MICERSSSKRKENIITETRQNLTCRRIRGIIRREEKEMKRGCVDFFAFWVKADRRYKTLCEDPAKKESSIVLGSRAIVSGIVGAAFAMLFLWGMRACFDHVAAVRTGSVAGSPVLALIGLAACAAGALATLLRGIVGGLVYTVYQFRLNRRPVRWVALAVCLLCFAAVVVFSAVMFFIR